MIDDDRTGVRSASPASARSAECIEAWLVEQVAEAAGLDPEEIDVGEPFASYGLGSLAAVRLSGELEDWLGLELSPILVYEYPTAAALGRYLADELERASERGADGSQAG